MGHRHTATDSRTCTLGADAWFISFGDLLTLLVCFFLLLTPRVSHIAEQSQSNQLVSEERLRRQIPGTDLASTSLVLQGDVPEAVPVWRDSVREVTVTQDRVQERTLWLRQVRSHLRAGGHAVVVLCSADAEFDVVSSVIGELDGIEEQAQSLRFEVATECDRWRTRFGPRQDLAGVVVLSM